MIKKIKYGFRLVFNIFKLKALFLSSEGKIKSSLLQLLSLNTTVFVEKGGRIELFGINQSEPGVVIEAHGGTILINGAFK